MCTNDLILNDYIADYMQHLQLVRILNIGILYINADLRKEYLLLACARGQIHIIYSKYSQFLQRMRSCLNASSYTNPQIVSLTLSCKYRLQTQYLVRHIGLHT